MRVRYVRVYDPWATGDPFPLFTGRSLHPVKRENENHAYRHKTRRYFVENYEENTIKQALFQHPHAAYAWPIKFNKNI